MGQLAGHKTGLNSCQLKLIRRARHSDASRRHARFA
jgi:hypothetical protein